MIKHHILLFLFTLFAISPSKAQEYFTGKIISPSDKETKVFYDRTQVDISAFVFQSVYKIMDKNKDLKYIVTLTHDQLKSIIYLAVKTEGGDSKGYAIQYEKKSSGLIFSDLSNTDTIFPLNRPYHYLISFTDSRRVYPVLHQIRTDNNSDIQLDPISAIRLRLNRQLINKIPVADRQTPEASASFLSFYNLKPDDPMTSGLHQLRGKLLVLKQKYVDSVSALRADIEKDIQARFKTNKVEANEKKYNGERKNGRPNGQGLLVINENIYSGKFRQGELEKGFVVLKNNDFEYLGGYMAKTGYDDLGWIRYNNGGYFVGRFSNGIMQEGVTLDKDKNGDIFLGMIKDNRRTGYGEMRSAKGNLYYGEFSDGKLVKGYAKEVDQFGYATYSKIEDDTKKPVDQRTAEAFFESVLFALN